MKTVVHKIKDFFKGEFVTDPLVIQEKFSEIQAFIFDWDGVFNAGEKNENSSSSFSEVDSMGINLLRFNHYLKSGNPPLTAILLGENNSGAYAFALREHFDSVYYNFKIKTEALHHFCFTYKLQPAQIAFVFDDVLDLSIASHVGLKIMVGRKCNPLLQHYTLQNKLADYITHADGGSHAVREMSELLIGLSGQYNETISNRINSTDTYKQYMLIRNIPTPVFYTSVRSVIIQQIPQ